MTSYFEIDGEIIEVDTISDPHDTSSISRSALEASYRLHQREQIADELVGDPNALHSKSTVPSLSEHWSKTSFHVLHEFAELDRRKQIYFLKNPYHFAGWGVGKIAEVIEMHWDYNKQRQAEWRGE